MNNNPLSYLKVCLNEINSKHQFYFDANDTIDILNGVYIFYQSESGTEFQKQIFDNDARVVQALAYGGFIGKEIFLLPPHQVELSDKIKSGLIEPSPQENYIELFWNRDLKYNDNFGAVLASNNSKIPLKELDEWVSHKGKDLFKAFLFSYKITWQERLIEIFDKEIFEFKDYDSDDIAIYDQNLFRELLDAFNGNEKRSGRSESNFRDVISLMYLANRVKDYNKAKNNLIPIPIYYDSQNFISIIPQRILENYFSIENFNKNVTFSEKKFALRSSSYFKLYSLVNFNTNISSRDKRYESFAIKQQEILSFKSKLDSIEYTEKFFSGSRKKVDSEREQLEDKISDYIDHDFFYTIFKFIREENIIIQKVYDDTQLPPPDEKSIKDLNDRVEKVKERLNREINGLVNSSVKTFREIDERVETLRNITDKVFEKGKHFDVFEDYSLFRFFIPNDFEKDLRVLFSSDGLLSKTDKVYKESIFTIWNLIFRNITQPDKVKIKEKNLFRLFSTFWVLSLHEKVVEIKVNDNDLHHSLLMLKGACINRAISEYKRQNISTKGLEEKYQSIIQILVHRCNNLSVLKDNEFEYGEILIALAYLNFHLWRQKGNELFLESACLDFKNFKCVSLENITAISYAKQAFEYFDKITFEENKHRIYSLNIYVYYILDSGNDQEFNKIKPLINDLISIKPKINSWHFRYDDTIARNLHRRSLLAVSKEVKINLANQALKILENSLSRFEELDGRDIREVSNYKIKLFNYIADLDS